MSWVEVLRVTSLGSVRRKPSTNHWAKCENSRVDFADTRGCSWRRNSSATDASGCSRCCSRLSGGRCRALYVRSVSDSHDVYGVFVLRTFGRVSSLETNRVMSSRLVADRTPGSRRTSVQTGSRWVTAQSSAPLRQPFLRQYDQCAAVAGTAGTLVAAAPPPVATAARVVVVTAAPVDSWSRTGPLCARGATESSEEASPRRHRAVTVSAAAHRGHGSTPGRSHLDGRRPAVLVGPGDRSAMRIGG